MSPDVIIVGAGPVGLTAALLLARHGVSVVILERRCEPPTEPRAVSVDDETMRVWQSCGVLDELSEAVACGVPGQPMCTYLSESGRPFFSLYQARGDLGHPHAAAIHQGWLEAALRTAVQRHRLITLRTGVEVVGVTQDSDGVTAAATHSSQTIAYSARWLVACDGSHSRVRSVLGIEMPGEEIGRPWLVANILDHGEPGHVQIRCDSRGSAVTMPLPGHMRRVEVELRPDEDAIQLTDERACRAILKRGWSGSDDAPMIRATRCQFRLAVAERWRDGRVFLAGDAAHTMPPFAGQGLCSGERDVANLTFKLAGVRQGWLAEGVLDSYESERRPHLEATGRLVRLLHALMTPRVPLLATVVQTFLRGIHHESRVARWIQLRGPGIRQVIRKGFVVRADRGGTYLPQPVVQRPDGVEVPLDTLLGEGMNWIMLGEGGRAASSRAAPMAIAGASTLVEGKDFVDPGKVLRRAFGDGAVILVRPDRVICVHTRPKRRPLPFARSEPWQKALAWFGDGCPEESRCASSGALRRSAVA